jgi:RHS repeat-associated protein
MLAHGWYDGVTNTQNSYSYDNLNRLYQIKYFDANGRTITYGYYANGLRHTVQDSTRSNNAATTYVYDHQNRVTSITQPNNTSSISYSYDKASNRTLMQTFANGTLVGNVNYGYNRDNWLQTITDTQTSKVTGYQYYNNGLRSYLDLPNNDHTYYVYDGLNRLTNLTEYQGSAGSTPMAAYTYTLNAANMRTQVVEADGSSIQWSYDNAYKLLGETHKNSSGTLTAQSFYTYTTTSSNRQSMTTGLSGSQVTTNYGYNLLDQLITVTVGGANTIYSYNGRGDLTSNGSYTFGYNAADQLTSVSGGASATYQYDADGRRVQQVNGGVTTNYTWDELSPYGDVVLETNGSNVAQTSYVLGNGELVSQNKLTGSGLSYVLHDGQGNVRELLDGSTGSVRSGETYTYDAFGKLSSGQSNPGTSYLYAGQQFDNSTGLYDMRARYYNPSDGRFLSMDTAAVDYQNPIELNRYVYTAENPINFSDPSGYGAIDYDALIDLGITFVLGQVAITGDIVMFVSIIQFGSLLLGAINNMHFCGNLRSGTDGPHCETYFNHRVAWAVKTFFDLFLPVMIGLPGSIWTILSEGIPAIFATALFKGVSLALVVDSYQIFSNYDTVAAAALGSGKFLQLNTYPITSFKFFPTMIVGDCGSLNNLMEPRAASNICKHLDD